MIGKRVAGPPRLTHATYVRRCAKRKGVSEWKQAAENKVVWAKTIRTKGGQARAIKERRSERTGRRTRSRPAKPQYSLVGRTVEKRFKHKWYEGEIISKDLCARTGLQIWRVRYDDSDEEDLYEGELRPLLI